MSMWVRIRSYDYNICNKGWSGEIYNWRLFTEDGRPVFQVVDNGKSYQAINGEIVTDDAWHLICWGKYRVENGVRLFIAVDGGPPITSSIIPNNLDIENNLKFKIAFYDFTYSHLRADELFILEGVKYTEAIGEDIYGTDIKEPGFPPDYWNSQYLKCYWQFNNIGIVNDISGNGNNGTHWGDPQIIAF